MKKLFFILFLVFIFCTGHCYAAQSFDEKKKEIIALYNSNNLEAAYKQILQLLKTNVIMKYGIY